MSTTYFSWKKGFSLNEGGRWATVCWRWDWKFFIVSFRLPRSWVDIFCRNGKWHLKRDKITLWEE